MPRRPMKIIQLLFYPLLGLVAVVLVRHRRVQLRARDLKAGGRYLLVPNHQSYLDIPMICACLPIRVLWRLGPVRFMLLNSIFDSAVHPLLVATGFFPARRHPGYPFGLDMARMAMRSGEAVMMFPEGRRSLPAESAPKHGVSVLADEGTEIIPIHLRWHRREWWRRVDIVIGQPFSASGMTPEEIMERVYSL